jgi:hypothetical protein
LHFDNRIGGVMVSVPKTINNSDIDNLNFIISKLENLDQQLDLNQTYINILVTDNGQVLSDMYK